MNTSQNSINTEMQSLLDKYLPSRRPVSLEDYDWERIRPETLDRDFLNALNFVTLVESDSDAYAEKHLAAADRSGTPWLKRFVLQTWLPEERMHHVPYRNYLVHSSTDHGISIDREIQEVRQRPFVHGEGYTDLQAATYGWLQELVTRSFYEAMIGYLQYQGKDNGSDAVLLKILGDIARQENFHRYVFLTGARTILKHQPHRKYEVVRAAAEFIMPGHQVVPHLQPLASGWSAKFRFSHRRLAEETARELRGLIGYHGLGRATVGYAFNNPVFWYFKVIAMLASPLTWLPRSPVNYLVGRFITAGFVTDRMDRNHQSLYG